MYFLYFLFYFFYICFCKSHIYWRTVPEIEPDHYITQRLSATGVIYKDHLYGFGGVNETVPNITYVTPSFVINTKNIPQLSYIEYETLNFTHCVLQKSVVIKKGVYEGCIIFYGGMCENSLYNNNTLIMYNISSNTYKQLPNNQTNPGGRTYHDMFVIDDTVYVYGGKSDSDELDRRIWYYNLTEERWDFIKTEPSPPARYKHVGSLYCKENSCYYTVFSGIYTITSTTQHIFLNDIWQYSFRTNSWITINEINDYQFNRYDSSAIQWREYMIIFSGYNSFHQATEILCMNVDFNGNHKPKWKRLNVEHINVMATILDINENDNMLIFITGQSPHYSHKLYYLYLDSSMIEDFPLPIQYYLYKYAAIASCVLISLICCCSTIKCCYKNNFLNIASISDGVIYFRGGATVVATATDEELVRGLTMSQIRKIKELDYNLKDFHNQNTCTICLIDFIERDKVKVLPCQHIYHTNCIMEWLYNSSLCPLCKRSVVNKKGYIEQDIQWVDI